MTLTVPDLPTGDYYVTARNSYGLSAPTEWSVENPNDDENTTLSVNLSPFSSTIQTQRNTLSV